jgi:glycerol-3-phosphate dehydrogenase (NAD(P)+)
LYGTQYCATGKFRGEKSMAIITIVGAGMMGSALAFPARENGNEVRLVGTHLDREIIDECRRCERHPKFDRDFPAGVRYYQIEELCEAIDGADFIIGGISSFGVDWFSDTVLPIVPDGVPVISVTKGLMDTEDGRLLTYPELWQARLDELGKNVPLCAIGGPCTSYELVAHDQTHVSFCGKNTNALRYIKAAMETDYYHISLTNDVVGIESAVALKNGYALGIALTIGINQIGFKEDTLHYNSQAAVFAQASKEMERLLEYQGAMSLNNLCVGIGDLYVTVYGGRTRLVGILLGRGYTIEEAEAKLAGVTLESLVVAKRVARAIGVGIARGDLRAEDFPLLLHIDEIITGGKAVNIPWESFTYSDIT